MANHPKKSLNQQLKEIRAYYDKQDQTSMIKLWEGKISWTDEEHEFLDFLLKENGLKIEKKI